MEKVWLNNYKANIPAEIVQDDTTIIDLFEKACKTYSNNRAVTCHNVSLTFRDVRDRVSRVAEGLARLGVIRGDRVAIILPNSIQYPISVFAIHALGAAVVNINPLYTAAEIEFVVKDSSPKVIITLDMFAEKLNGFHNKYGIEHIVLSKIADPYPVFKRTLIGLSLRYISKVKPKLNYTPKMWLDLYHNDNTLNDYAKISYEDIAFIQYTGATTGHPKGAMLLHRNIVSNIKQIFAVLDAQVAEMDKQIVITALPLYHIFSLTANLYTFFLHGSENVMIPNAKDIKSLIKTMNTTPFTIFNSLDTLYNKLLETPLFMNSKHPTYKYGICGGMATRESVAKNWQQHTGLYPTNCYGLTESSPCVSMNYFDDEFSGAVGYPVPSTEIDIRSLDEEQKSLQINEKGLIFIRGPQLMLGYWNNPEQTKKALSEDGWFNTGDIGFINEKGQLVISGRETEMVIVSGFNVYPAEVEQVVDMMPQVHEVAVVGYPAEETGESVHAFIVLSGNKLLTRDEIRAHCRKNLTKYKMPKTITIVEELPKTLVGKIDKKALVAKYLAVNLKGGDSE